MIVSIHDHQSINYDGVYNWYYFVSSHMIWNLSVSLFDQTEVTSTMFSIGRAARPGVALSLL